MHNSIVTTANQWVQQSCIIDFRHGPPRVLRAQALPREVRSSSYTINTGDRAAKITSGVLKRQCTVRLVSPSGWQATTAETHNQECSRHIAFVDHVAHLDVLLGCHGCILDELVDGDE